MFGTVRIWCGSCDQGEAKVGEAYTVIIVDENVSLAKFKLEGMSDRDISTHAMQVAVNDALRV